LNAFLEIGWTRNGQTGLRPSKIKTALSSSFEKQNGFVLFEPGFGNWLNLESENAVPAHILVLVEYGFVLQKTKRLGLG